jgi:hypothetical protein
MLTIYLRDFIFCVFFSFFKTGLVFKAMGRYVLHFKFCNESVHFGMSADGGLQNVTT